jgi:ferritin-like metal-binding protein YciE
MPASKALEVYRRKCDFSKTIEPSGRTTSETAKPEILRFVVQKHAARDAGMLAAAQTVEHYEIARYGTLIAWADQLGMKEASKLLGETLDEEKKTDQLLTRLAEANINQKAA